MENVLTTSRRAKVIRDTIAQLLNMAKSVHLHKDQIVKNSGTLKLVMDKLTKFREQYNDEEFMKTLSPPEQQALIKNAQAYATTMRELQNEIDYLDMNKYPPALSTALNYLEEAYMLFNFILVELVGENGEIAFQKLAVIKPKNFAKGSYKNQIMNLETEFDVMIADLRDELRADFPSDFDEIIVFYHYALKSLVLGWEWWKLEVDRDKTGDSKSYKIIEMPKEVVPEKPKSPENVDPEEAEEAKEAPTK